MLFSGCGTENIRCFNLMHEQFNLSAITSSIIIRFFVIWFSSFHLYKAHWKHECTYDRAFYFNHTLNTCKEMCKVNTINTTWLISNTNACPYLNIFLKISNSQLGERFFCVIWLLNWAGFLPDGGGSAWSKGPDSHLTSSACLWGVDRKGKHTPSFVVARTP